MNFSAVNLDRITALLFGHLGQGGFAGWDPYDGLSSRVFQKSPFFCFRVCRLAWIQFFRRSPVNLRRIFRVTADTNCKGLALVIRGLLCRPPVLPGENAVEKAAKLGKRILANKSHGRPYFCAGYPFYWQARAFSVPPGTPNLVVSVFAAEAFLDLYEEKGDENWLKAATEAGTFIEKELVVYRGKEGICFGYIPGEPARVHNVNLLGAALYARLHHYTGVDRYRRYAKSAVAYSVRRQLDSGAWFYGEAGHHHWIDNFHTGFNLTAIQQVSRCLGTDRWRGVVNRGLDFHLTRHFTGQRVPRYYSHRKYPVDIHNYAQGILTCLDFDRKSMAQELAVKAVRAFWHPRRHYFFYQKTPLFSNRIDYFRWSQAWMFYALAKLTAARGEMAE